MKEERVNEAYMNDANNNVIEIDLVEIFHVIMANIVKIAICTILGAALLLGYAYYFVEPTYQSTAKLYIVSTSNGSVVDLTDLNIGKTLTKDYEELILSYTVLDEVIDDLNLDMDYKMLSNYISLENPEDTRVININVTTTDKKLSMDIANDLAKVTCDYLSETMSTNPPNIAQVAREADVKAAPSFTKYTLIGALIGFMLSCLYFIMLFMMDDTISSAEDIEKFFGVTTLTTIPRSDKIADDADEKKSSRKKGGR